MKFTMYGAPICGECVAMKNSLSKYNELEINYIDITESTKNLKEFLKYRDQEAIFDEVKANGKIGIPFFVLEDGTKTFEIEEHLGFKLEMEEVPAQACSLDGKGKC